LVADPKKTTDSKRVIIEVTPHMRFLMAKKGIDWSTAKCAEAKLYYYIAENMCFYEMQP
jgi:hypothetical protein